MAKVIDLEEARNAALDKRDCAERECMYYRCDQEGPPTVITAIWSYYHQSCYEKRQREIWGDE